MFLKKYISLILIIVFFLAINIITLVYIKETAFPFITMSYRYTINDFNTDKLNLDLPLNPEFKNRVLEDLGPVLKGKEEVFFISSVLAEYVRSYLFYKSNANAIVDDLDKILASPGEDPAICSGYAQFLASVAQALGYQSRVVWLNGHTISEVYFPEYGWVLLDSDGNLIFQDKDGKYVDLLYVVEHFKEVTPKRLAPQTDNDGDSLSSGSYKVLENNDIVVVIEGPRLLDFPERTKSPRILIGYILGKDEVAKGIQYIGIGTGREKLGNLRYSIIFLVILDFSALIVFIFYLIFLKIIKKKYVRDSWDSGL